MSSTARKKKVKITVHEFAGTTVFPLRTMTLHCQLRCFQKGSSKCFTLCQLHIHLLDDSSLIFMKKVSSRFNNTPVEQVSNYIAGLIYFKINHDYFCYHLKRELWSVTPFSAVNIKYRDRVTVPRVLSLPGSAEVRDCLRDT